MKNAITQECLRNMSILSVVGIALHPTRPELLGSESREERFRQLLPYICNLFNVSEEVIKSSSRKRNHVDIRHLFCYVARFGLKITTKRIGYALGGRDHTTILSANERATNLLAINDANFCEIFQKFMEKNPMKIDVRPKRIIKIYPQKICQPKPEPSPVPAQRVKAEYTNHSPYGIATELLNTHE